MVAEMERQYRVPSALGRHWVERCEVLPLLDGLDEVEKARERRAWKQATRIAPGARAARR